MMDLAKTSDINLLTELVHANREAALETLYYRYNDMIRVMLREQCMVDANEMDDFLQMTWLKVLEYFDTYDPAISTQSWLFKVASGVVRTQHIARGRHKRIPTDHIKCMTDAGSRSILCDMRVPKPTNDPAELLMVRERLQKTLEAISVMGPAQERAIHYVFIEGLSYEEAAEILGVTKVALSATIHRVREKLRLNRGIAA